MTYEHESAGKVETGSSNSGRPPDRGGSFVYFIGSLGGAIKIGRSARPTARLSQLQCAHAEKLHLLAAMRGGADLEAKLHAQFAAHRIRGELFAACPDLLMLIWETASGAPPYYLHQLVIGELHAFLTDWTVRVPGVRTRSSVLYAAYCQWAATAGEPVRSQKTFSMAMKRAGVVAKKSNGMHWLDIRLREEMVR